MRRRDLIKLLGAVMTVFPQPVRAQPGKKAPVIGVLWHAGSAEEEGKFYQAVQNGFRDLGYVEGQTIRLEHRFPAEQYERFAAFAAELVRLPVDVLVPVTAPAAVAAKKATSSIPIVFLLVPDPVSSGLVENLARPGGNATGFSTIATDLAAKRVELLKQAVPGTARVAVLVNAGAAEVASRTLAEIRPAAARLGVTIQPIEARLPADLAHAFAVIARDRFDGVAVAPDGMFYNERRHIAELSLKHRLPTVHPSRDTVVAGSFMSYGPDLEAICRRAPAYVDKILKGAKPTDLPVEQPTKFELAINAKTARALGLTIPPSLLLRADQIIE